MRLPIARRFFSTANARSPIVTANMLPKDSFKGKIALVTGGGTGLGRGIATKLSDLGATVAIMSRKRGVVDLAAQEIEEITGNRVIALQADVRDADQVQAALDELEEAAGVPTIVVNNAAGNFISPFERLNAKGFGTIVDIVLKGTANVTLDAGKRMIREDNGGVFLNITTTYAETGSGYVVPSAAAKAGVSAMIKSLAVEWGKYGIRFVGIAPGPIKTKGAFDRLDPTGAFEERLRTNNPLQRFGEIPELANLATYMTSDYASWLNGEIIRFDGGETVANAGEFNILGEVAPAQWDELENAIRNANAKGKIACRSVAHEFVLHFASDCVTDKQIPMAAAYKLMSTESLRACGILEEALEKLSFLGSITPDILQHREELSQIVGEEISRIIQDQRQLEAKYEKLIAQRTVLKGLANKSKFKENQREIQEVSRLLRESTKSLCRNLKENPNFAGNLLKIQQEREGLMELLSQTMAELKKHGTFDTLLAYVHDGQSAQEKAHQILKKEREAVDEVKRLSADLQREKNDHQKEVTDHRSTILQLKEQLLAVKSKTQIDIRYARSEAKAKRSSTARMYNQLLEEEDDKIKELQAKCTTETRVHEETVAFLKDRHDQLVVELSEWTTKYQQDLHAKQQQLQLLQTHKAANAQKLDIFQKRWQDEMAAIQQKEEERTRVLELEALRKEERKAQNTAARIIQVAYRLFHAKKEEKRKNDDANKKGKKGGKKKGKK